MLFIVSPSKAGQIQSERDLGKGRVGKAKVAKQRGENKSLDRLPFGHTESRKRFDGNSNNKIMVSCAVVELLQVTTKIRVDHSADTVISRVS